MKQPERLLNARKHVRNGGFDQISHYLRGLPLAGGEGSRILIYSQLQGASRSARGFVRSAFPNPSRQPPEGCAFFPALLRGIFMEA